MVMSFKGKRWKEGIASQIGAAQNEQWLHFHQPLALVQAIGADRRKFSSGEVLRRG